MRFLYPKNNAAASLPYSSEKGVRCRYTENLDEKCNCGAWYLSFGFSYNV